MYMRVSTHRNYILSLYNIQLIFEIQFSVKFIMCFESLPSAVAFTYCKAINTFIIPS